MSIGKTLAATFVGGALSTCFFQRPLLNSAGIKALALGGLQGTAIQVAAFALSYMAQQVADKIENHAWGTTAESAFLSTYTICAMAAPFAADGFTKRLGTSLQAFTRFALSCVLGYIVGRSSGLEIFPFKIN